MLRRTGNRARSAPAKRDPTLPEDIGELQRPPHAGNRRRRSLAALASALVTGIGIGWLAAAQWGPLPSHTARSQVATAADLAPAALPEEPSNWRQPVLTQRDGMYLVGTDLTPGRYVATGTGSACYYATLRDLSGSLDAIVTTHFGDAWGRRVELDEGEYFETDACGAWYLESPS